MAKSKESRVRDYIEKLLMDPKWKKREAQGRTKGRREPKVALAVDVYRELEKVNPPRKHGRQERIIATTLRLLENIGIHLQPETLRNAVRRAGWRKQRQ